MSRFNRWNIPFPTVILSGKTANLLPDAAFRAARKANGGRCPACEDKVQDGHYCVQCDSAGPFWSARIYELRLQTKLKEKDLDRKRAARDSLSAIAKQIRKSHQILSEQERRRIWFGGKWRGLPDDAEVSNRAKVGRDWLREIGQEPNFELVLNERGLVIGKIVVDPETGAHVLMPASDHHRRRPHEP